MKWFRDDDWSWNGLRQPYRVLERHPELALVDRRIRRLGKIPKRSLSLKLRED